MNPKMSLILLSLFVALILLIGFTNLKDLALAQPMFQSQGMRIVFSTSYFNSEDDGLTSRNEQVYAVDLDGSNLRNLTHTRSGIVNIQPRWSPDGSRIAFLSNQITINGITSRMQGGEIYVMDADGDNLTRLTDNSFSEDIPRWSPDGRHIAFVYLSADGPEIYTISSDGLTENFVVDGYEPVWSPDGQRIVFSIVGVGDDNSEIGVVDIDGENVVNLTNHPAYDRNPVWSPDGSNIAFASRREEGDYIFLIDAITFQITQLTLEPIERIHSLTWSPDGKLLAVEADNVGYFVDADNGGLYGISNVRSSIQWLPDNNGVLFYTSIYDDELRNLIGQMVFLSVNCMETENGCGRENQVPIPNTNRIRNNGFDVALTPKSRNE